MKNSYKCAALIVVVLFFSYCSLGIGDSLYQLVQAERLSYDYNDNYNYALLRLITVIIAFIYVIVSSINAPHTESTHNFVGLSVASAFFGSFAFGAVAGPIATSFFNEWIFIAVIGFSPAGLLLFKVMNTSTRTDLAK